MNGNQNLRRNALTLALGAAMGLTVAAPQAAEITVAVASGFTTLDPYDASDTLSRTVSSSFYEGLFSLDDQNRPVPALATGYEVSDDGLVYTMKLREGVKFQDGTDFDANAVKINFDRLLDKANNLSRRGFLSMIDKVEVVDPMTVRFTLQMPFSAFVSRLATGTAVMICPKAIEQYGGDVAFKPCGTGPYIMKDYNPSERLYVVKNPNYWQKGLPKLDGILWKPVVENSTRAAMLRTGEAQFAYTIPAEQVKTLQGVKGIEVLVEPSIISRYLIINNQKKPFTDPRVRAAINYAINKEALVKVAFAGYAEPMTGVIPKEISGFENLGVWPYDPKKARELLAEAGFPNGFETELWSGYNNTTAAKVIQFIQQQLRQVGIKTNLRTLEAGQRVAMIESVRTVEEAQSRLYYIGWSNSTAEPDWCLRPIFDSRNAPPVLANEGYYVNKKVDELFDKALLETDLAKREENYREIQRLIWQDAGFAPLVTEMNISGRSLKLKNFRVLPSGSYDFYQAELEP